MKPSIIAFDFETTGLDYWDPDFRVLSCAFAWSSGDGRIKTRYLTDEDEVRAQIVLIQEAGIKLVAHNSSYELGVCLCRLGFSSIEILDTMRLVQVYDNGGKDVKSTGPMSLEDELASLTGELKIKTGLGLESAVTRLLPKEFHDHKQPYYKWLRDNAGVKKGQEGANLHKLPEDMLESYNTMDAILTLMLYQKITEDFAGKYDWTYDHKLHMAACERIVKAKARGIAVDRKLLEQNAVSVQSEVTTIQSNFLDKYKTEIDYLEAVRWENWVSAPKTERGQLQRAVKPMPDDLKFNPGSTKQLAELFVDRLGIQPTFWTEESKASKKSRETNPDKLPFVPRPSMKAAHLPTYGDGGAMLQNLKKRGLVLGQQTNLLNFSAGDGRWHHDLKACGTKTGRYSGGGGLNIQGLARKDKALMGCLLPDPGKSFVSIDLAAGEPTVIAHYSQDKLYNAATFGMVGKDPYWDGDLLMIDSPYTMFGSISPIGKDSLRRTWDEGKFEGWRTMTDDQRKKVWSGLGPHKTISLAKVYGQGAKGTIKFAANFGVKLDYATSKTLHHQFWYDLFPNVRMLGERLEVQFKRQGYLLNEFGYRMVPERESLALNYTIQSSVSGIIKLFDQFVLDEAPWATWVTVIHDEQIWEVPTDRVEEFRQCVQRATKRLNDFLGWTVEIRTGFAPGNNLYEAK